MVRRDPRAPEAGYLAFWREHHLCTLTTHRPDGTPHVVPVGVTYDPEAGLARVITNTSSAKVAHVRAAGAGGAQVAVCQVERRALGDAGGRRHRLAGPGAHRRRGRPLRGALRAHPGAQPAPRRHRDRPDPGDGLGLKPEPGTQPCPDPARQEDLGRQTTSALVCWTSWYGTRSRR